MHFEKMSLKFGSDTSLVASALMEPNALGLHDPVCLVTFLQNFSA